LVVAADEDAVKSVPAFDDEREITPEYESEIHPCYGLEGTQASEDRGRYGAHLGCSEGEHPGEVRPGMRMGDTETGSFAGTATAKRACAKPKAILKTS
jgi:hypothetical protein